MPNEEPHLDSTADLARRGGRSCFGEAGGVLIGRDNTPRAISTRRKADTKRRAVRAKAYGEVRPLGYTFGGRIPRISGLEAILELERWRDRRMQRKSLFPRLVVILKKC
jgi:hypothetical protein